MPEGRRETIYPLFWPWCSFQAPPRRPPEVFRRRSLRTEQRARRRHGARELGRHRDQVRSTSRGTDGRNRRRSSACPGIAGAVKLPRKEVIQPQLPLRLPCYDFTPIIDPTFDGSLPCGLGHRLRVLPTFVV